MLDKDKQKSKSIISQLIKEDKIIKPLPGTGDFFLAKSIESLQLSKRIFEISQDEDDPLESYMWVITTAYYSMFFAATALLAYFKHRIDVEVGIHKLTYHALIYYFLIADNKLQKHFIEEYKEMYDNAEKLLQISEEKAIEILEHFKFEQSKRTRFTYEMGRIAEEQKAKTSLKRAEEFTLETRKVMRR